MGAGWWNSGGRDSQRLGNCHQRNPVATSLDSILQLWSWIWAGPVHSAHHSSDLNHKAIQQQMLISWWESAGDLSVNKWVWSEIGLKKEDRKQCKIQLLFFWQNMEHIGLLQEYYYYMHHNAFKSQRSSFLQGKNSNLILISNCLRYYTEGILMNIFFCHQNNLSFVRQAFWALSPAPKQFFTINFSWMNPGQIF